MERQRIRIHHFIHALFSRSYHQREQERGGRHSSITSHMLKRPKGGEVMSGKKSPQFYPLTHRWRWGNGKKRSLFPSSKPYLSPNLITSPPLRSIIPPSPSLGRDRRMPGTQVRENDLADSFIILLFLFPLSDPFPSPGGTERERWKEKELHSLPSFVLCVSFFTGWFVGVRWKERIWHRESSLFYRWKDEINKR